MAGDAVASTSGASSAPQGGLALNLPELHFDNDYRSDFYDIGDDVAKMQCFLREKAKEDVLLFAIAKAPDTVFPLMLEAMLNLEDPELCKPLLRFQEEEHYYTPLELAAHQNLPEVTSMLALIERDCQGDAQGVEAILMAQSAKDRNPLIFIVDAQISAEAFSRQLDIVERLCKQLERKSLIKLLSQITTEKDNLFMMMCQRKPAWLKTFMLALLNRGFRPHEFAEIFLQQSETGQNLFAYALQAPREDRSEVLQGVLRLAYRFSRKQQIEFIKGGAHLPGYEVLEGENVLKAAMYVLDSQAFRDFLNAEAGAGETFAQDLMHVAECNARKGPNILQLAIQQNALEKVRLILKCLEHALTPDHDPQKRLQQILQHWTNRSSVEKAGDVLWLAIMHCPKAVPDIIDFMAKYDPEGLRNSLTRYTYASNQGRIEKLYRIMSHASAKLPPEDFEAFLNKISEYGLLFACLNNDDHPKEQIFGHNQISHCLMCGTQENIKVLLKKVSEMDVEQQRELIINQVLYRFPFHNYSRQQTIKHILEFFAPLIQEIWPEKFMALLKTGLEQVFDESRDALENQRCFLSMIERFIPDNTRIYNFCKDVITCRSICYRKEDCLEQALKFIIEHFPPKERNHIFSACLNATLGHGNSNCIQARTVIDIMKGCLRPEDNKKILKISHYNTRGKKVALLNIIKGHKLENEDPNRGNHEALKSEIEQIYSGQYCASSAGSSSGARYFNEKSSSSRNPYGYSRLPSTPSSSV